MPSLRQIKTKISSVRGTRRIMSAMKLISAVKLQRVQGPLIASRPYSDAFAELARNLASVCDPSLHPLLRVPEEKKRLHVVFMTSDRGLCGSFNSNLIRKLETYLVTEASRYEEVTFRFLGRRGRDHFRRLGYTVIDSYTGTNERNFTQTAKAISSALTEEFSDGLIDDVVLVYNFFISALRQETIFERLLPIERRKADEGLGVDYIFEPDRGDVLEAVLPEYVRARVERAVFETITSEHAARMAAMDSATRNADEVVRQLTLLFNKTRQAYITKELMDIVNGTEALKKGGAV